MDSLLHEHVLQDGSVSVADLRAWLRIAKAGDAYVYHRGFLALGTDRLGNQLAPTARQRLAGVAQYAWVAATRGQVHLLQRRLAASCFEYVVVARAQSAKPTGMWPELIAPMHAAHTDQNRI